MATPRQGHRQFRPPLPPLNARPVRVGLLAWSYEDAVFSSSDPDGRSRTFGSRALTFNEDLWRRGSYASFQAALEALRDQDREGHRSFYASFINGHREPNHAARTALATLTRAMETGKNGRRQDIYVPAEISEAKGYKPTEAALYDRVVRN